MIMSIRTGKRVYTRTAGEFFNKIDSEQYADEMFWLMVCGIKSGLVTEDELVTLIDQAVVKVGYPEIKMHGTQRNPMTRRHKNILKHDKDFDNGVEYCLHRDIDNCRWCEYSRQPDLFDPGCVNAIKVKRRKNSKDKG